jgi:predicted HD phosphohydrolase
LPSNIRTRSADWNRSIAKPLQHVGCDGVDSRGVGSLQAMLVTLAGHDILIGRALLRPTTAGDYANFILACLTHDIGHVRGIVQGDEDDSYVVDVTGRTMRLPRGLSDAALAPYHVDRSKLFVVERLDSVEDSRRDPNCPGN